MYKENIIPEQLISSDVSLMFKLKVISSVYFSYLREKELSRGENNNFDIFSSVNYY